MTGKEKTGREVKRRERNRKRGEKRKIGRERKRVLANQTKKRGTEKSWIEK